MSAEEYISLAYAGCSADDMEDYGDGDGETFYEVDPSGSEPSHRYDNKNLTINQKLTRRNQCTGRYYYNHPACKICIVHKMRGDKGCEVHYAHTVGKQNNTKNIINKETAIMTTSLINKRVIGIRFVGSDQTKTYSYLTDIELEEGDYVVVDTQYGPKTAVVAQVKALSKTARDIACKWVICKIDLKSFQERLRKYELVAEIEASIEEEMASTRRIQYYLEAAKINPNIQKLVAQLQDLLDSKPQLEESSDAKS